MSSRTSTFRLTSATVARAAWRPARSASSLAAAWVVIPTNARSATTASATVLNQPAPRHVRSSQSTSAVFAVRGVESETRRSVNSPLIRPTRYPHFALGAAIECESLHRVVEALRHSGEYGPPVAGRSGRSPGIGDRATVADQHGVD